MRSPGAAAEVPARAQSRLTLLTRSWTAAPGIVGIDTLPPALAGVRSRLCRPAGRYPDLPN
jgi:hypothetical protein